MSRSLSGALVASLLARLQRRGTLGDFLAHPADEPGDRRDLQALLERGRSDFFVGGDMFVYYSFEQARDIVAGRRYFRGPDVFYVSGVERRERKAWVACEEDGRLPDVIIELLSPSTAEIDRTIKKDLYSRTFRTPQYFLYDPETEKLEGFHLVDGTYQPLIPNAQGRLWSEQLGLELGHWHGIIRDLEADSAASLLSRRPSGSYRGRGGTPARRGRTHGVPRPLKPSWNACASSFEVGLPEASQIRYSSLPSRTPTVTRTS